MPNPFRGILGRRKTKSKGEKSESQGAGLGRNSPVAIHQGHRSTPTLSTPDPPPQAEPPVTLPAVVVKETEVDAKPEPKTKIDETVFERIPGPSQEPQRPDVSEIQPSENGDDAFGVDDDAPQIVLSYESIAVLEQIKLPRGGFSVDTKAVGRVQVSWYREGVTVILAFSCD